MQITYNFLGEKFNNKYPYTYRIGLAGIQLDKMEKIMDWIRDIELPCIVAGSGLYVKDEAAVNFFILKWA